MYIFQKRNYRSKIYFTSKYILFLWDLYLIKHQFVYWHKISKKKKEIKLFPFPFVCVRVFVCSSAVHGKYGAFQNLAKAHAQIIICLPHSDSHTQLINTRTLGHTHKWFLHACRHTHTQTHRHQHKHIHTHVWVRTVVQPGWIPPSVEKERSNSFNS